MSTPHAEMEPVLAEPTDHGMLAFAEQFRTPGRVRSRATRPDLPSLVLLQPHPDDCALSLGGTLVQLDHPLRVVTVCSESGTAPSSTSRYVEDLQFGRLLGARIAELGFRESPSLAPRWTGRQVEMVARNVGANIADGGILLAPAAVSRHVDHLGVHTVARNLGGPLLLWEDVAFWAIYASSVEDRVLFSERNRDWLSEQLLLAIDISSHVRSKAALLACYGSQSDELWRPLRYGWSAARELGRAGYCERLFVPASQLVAVAELLGASVEEGPILQYGTALVRTAWAAIRRGQR